MAHATVLYIGSNDGFYTLGSAGGNWRLNQRGLAGTKVTQVALHPTQLLTFYAAVEANSGQPAGLYRTTSNGFDWEHLLPGTVSALAVAVDEVKKRRTRARDDESEETEEQPFTMYAATSDPLRVYRADGDENWQATASYPAADAAVCAILPLTRNILYVGLTNGKVLYSEDGGEMWHGRGQVEGDIRRLVRVGNDLFASTGQGVSHSTDGGNTWEQLNSFYLDAGPLAAFQPTTEPGVLLVGGGDDSSHTIYRLTNDQLAFTTAAFDPDPGNGMDAISDVAVHPTVRGACYAVTLTQGWASSDKGISWELIQSDPIPNANCMAVAKI